MKNLKDLTCLFPAGFKFTNGELLIKSILNETEFTCSEKQKLILLLTTPFVKETYSSAEHLLRRKPALLEEFYNLGTSSIKGSSESAEQGVHSTFGANLMASLETLGKKNNSIAGYYWIERIFYRGTEQEQEHFLLLLFKALQQIFRKAVLSDEGEIKINTSQNFVFLLWEELYPSLDSFSIKLQEEGYFTEPMNDAEIAVEMLHVKRSLISLGRRSKDELSFEEKETLLSLKNFFKRRYSTLKFGKKKGHYPDYIGPNSLFLALEHDKIRFATSLFTSLKNSGLVKTVPGKKGMTSVVLNTPWILNSLDTRETAIYPILDLPTFNEFFSGRIGTTQSELNVRGFKNRKLNEYREIQMSAAQLEIIHKQNRQKFAINDQFLLEVLLNQKKYLTIYLNGAEKRPEITRFLNVGLNDIPAVFGSRWPSNIIEEKDKNDFAKFLYMKNEFYAILKLAVLFSYHHFSFQNFVDYRGRIYANGYPLTPLGKKNFTRKLIKFPASSMMFEYDVHAQMLQIFGLLAADENLLLYTGLLSLENLALENYNGRSDIYAYLAARFQNRAVTLLLQEADDDLRVFKLEIISFLSGRNVFKKVLMGSVYGQNVVSQENDFLVNPDLVQILENFPDADKKAFCKFLAWQIRIIFTKKELTKVHLWRIQFKRLVKWITEKTGRKNQLRVSVDGAFYFKNRTRKQAAARLGASGSKLTFRKDEKFIDKKTGIISFLYDGKAFNRSIIPNFVRAIDAAIIKKVLHSYQQKNKTCQK